MKLHSSATSPYVRKVRVLLLEAGLDTSVEQIPTAVTPTSPNTDLNADNPIGKVPALLTEDGMALYDSPVICEYLDSLHDGAKMFPPPGPDRWLALRRQALGDGLLDAAILGRYETSLRPAEQFWPDWMAAQKLKIERSLDAMTDEAGELDGVVDIGTITFACALGYLDFRYNDMQWCDGRPALAAWYEAFSQRPSMQATEAPEADPLK
ncbi:MAG: glutathione S-transferase [Rhodospirillaceae bacterium]|nr:glutathione S-transferase [Rhodospirillaceae bacterium]MBT4487913.1 glutathione S-transferase [Rhodospirillaceae bacterium]MBT5193064.1 glutathione S-transferase [Rhodospirillaceae bacterium]MBT5896678.1 glutathione S-transferase [Rhodospirillaceae bacterium]MBT6428984.1 glutathione S-transferase [Rhodospirillaceae bacterium]